MLCILLSFNSNPEGSQRTCHDESPFAAAPIAALLRARALRAFTFRVLDGLPLSELVEAAVFDSGAVKEEIASLALDEPETLVRY